MKKIILYLVFTLSTFSSSAQSDIMPNDNVVVQNINPVPYRLYPTQNLWTFIKLNTRNGREIYLLGAVHDRHPGILLSEANFQFVQDLHKHGDILFTEDPTAYDINSLIPDLHNIFQESNLWNIKKMLNS